MSGRDRHLWRLADLYLLRVEANIRAGRVADAVGDFNVLRARAAIPGQDNTMGPAELAQLNADRSISCWTSGSGSWRARSSAGLC